MQYKQFRYKVSEQLKRANNYYFRNKFASAAGNMKNTWKLVNSILGAKSKKTTLPNSLKCNNETVNCRDGICNAFNQFCFIFIYI